MDNLNFNQRMAAFVALGNRFKQAANDQIAHEPRHQNAWFSPQNVRFALQNWSDCLTLPQLSAWLDGYQIADSPTQKNIGIIMAGNIPMVGFHDLMCVLLSGHRALVKISSSDKILMRFAIDGLIEIEPRFEERIEQVELLKNFDAIIATGSGNTSRYFDYYFAHVPSIIRKNRTSVAVLMGKENEQDLVALGQDIFTYFGLGCRNVSKLYVPEGYDFIPFFDAMEVFSDIKNHYKYFNNYEYNLAILLVNGTHHYTNGFLIATESQSLVSSIGVLYYETYASEQDLADKILAAQPNIQCVVGAENIHFLDAVPFGLAQTPQLSGYADGVDTLAFLNSI